MASKETIVGDDAQVKEATGRDLSIWRLKLHLDGHSGEVNAVAFSNDGELLASASEDGTVRLWNTTTKKGIRKLKSSDSVTAVVFSPDGQMVASASEDETVRLWNPRTGEQLFDLEGYSDPVRAVAFSPDSQRLASASDDKTVRLWNPMTGKQLQKLNGHSDWVNGIAFSPDGRLLASASYDQTIRLWNSLTGEQLLKLEGHTDMVSAVAFSPDGRLLASASEDKTVRLWNPITGKQLFGLEGHSDAVRAVAFSPDSQRLASGSDDKTVRLWNSLTGEHLQELKEHSHPVEGVAFSPDGALLASASGDRTIILWTEEAEEALLQEFLGFAGHDSALDAKIRTLGPGLLRMLESLKDPLLHATAIALVEIPARHMTFADTSWAYKLGDKAHEIEIDEDDWGGVANVAQMKLGSYVLDGFYGWKICVSQSKTTADLTNGLEKAKWLVEALIRFWQYRNAWFVLIDHKLEKTFAIVQTTDSTEVISCQTMRGEPVMPIHGAEHLFFDPQNVANEVHQVNQFLISKMMKGPDNYDESDESDEIIEDGEDNEIGEEGDERAKG